MTKPYLKILAYEDTCLGPLCLRERELLSQPGTIVTEVTLNHEFLMSSFNTDSERVISNRSVEIHGDKNIDALVGGLGLGYTAAELLKHDNVASVEVIEFLPPVIDWMNQGLVPLSGNLANNGKLTIVEADVYAYLWSPPAKTFDLIVIDVDHSPSDQLDEQEHSFYTMAGLQRAKAHLKPGGVLAVWSYAQSSDFADALRNTFQSVSVEPVTTLNTLVGHEQTDWLFFGRDDEP
ncbi:spermidine synthase [Rubripirellula obstinata]|uniref:Spermidine synthase n=1 Tax=Rubripirellula obstinata TaxID=406547 RepID=A0A5B1CB90_9BACT|nr:hypothetical protein [Rubripirellula obstinata]KAA1257826.1 spermidine synthase [Rubripirellula obstinata]